MAMAWGQGALFAKANKQVIQHTKFLLEKYTEMLALMRDFEEYEQEMQQVGIDQTDLHTDKTANATILIEKQRWVYKKYEFYTHQIERAQRLIKDEEARKAIEYRYIQGFTRKETMLFFRRSLSDSTIKRKIDEGITSIANSLKLMGIFDNDLIL